jgi:cation:H+ antiporter
VGRAALGFALWSSGLIITAIFLSYTGDEVSNHEFTGGITVGKTFVGTFLLAAATSLPELSVSIQAARIGAPGMAVGNVLGSNLFNLAVIPICQMSAWLGKGPPVLYSASRTHIFTGGVTIVMTAIVLGSILRPPKRKVGPMGVESAIIAAIYLAGVIVIWIMGDRGW